MAIYHLSTKPVSRSSGRSAVASAAYRCAVLLTNHRDGLVHEFTRKEGVEHIEIVLPDGLSADWALDRSALWNAAEFAEKRKDARVAREFEIALPHELSPEGRLKAARAFAQDLANRYGAAVDFAIHSPSEHGDIRNYHAHVLMTTRQVGRTGLGEKTYLEHKNARLLANGMATTDMQLRDIRQAWEGIANRQLQREGLDVRIDHRSHAERGLELSPTEHMGVHASQMQQQGMAVERGRLDDEAARQNAALIRRKPEQVLTLISHEKSVFDRHDIAKTLHRYINDDAQMFRNAFAAVMASPALVELQAERIDPETGDVSNARYSTREMIDLELAMAERAMRMAHARRHGVDRHHVDRAIEKQDAAIAASAENAPARLSDEQRQAIEHITGAEGIAAVVGFAGAGKSTMLAAAREAWEAHGYQVHGAALSGKAAEGLEESSCIESRTLASWSYSWDHGRDLLSRRDVFVIDEAGMAGSRQLARFIGEAEARGAKIVLVGDHEQLQAIGAGAPFRAIAEQIGHAELSGIRRQRHDWQRQASVAFATHKTAEGLAAYRDHGDIHFAESRDEAMSQIVRDYVADSAEHPDGIRVAMAHRRADVRALNAAIRGELQNRQRLERGHGQNAGADRGDRGDVEDRGNSGDVGELTFQTSNGKRAFAPGDRIIFLENNRDLGVKNGMLGTVEHVEKGRIVARLDGRGGDSVIILTDTYQAIDHGYATTVHKNQGATVDRAFVLASGTMDRHLAYVAMTRHRDSVQLYADITEFTNAGRLVDHGVSPYEHNPQARESYFVTLEDDKGNQHTVWGVDLKRAMRVASPKIGDRISLQHEGATPVTLPDGTKAERNAWRAVKEDELAYQKLASRLSRSGAKETTLDYISDFAERRGIASDPWIASDQAIADQLGLRSEIELASARDERQEVVSRAAQPARAQQGRASERQRVYEEPAGDLAGPVRREDPRNPFARDIDDGRRDDRTEENKGYRRIRWSDLMTQDGALPAPTEAAGQQNSLEPGKPTPLVPAITRYQRSIEQVAQQRALSVIEQRFDTVESLVRRAFRDPEEVAARLRTAMTEKEGNGKIIAKAMAGQPERFGDLLGKSGLFGNNKERKEALQYARSLSAHIGYVSEAWERRLGEERQSEQWQREQRDVIAVPGLTLRSAEIIAQVEKIPVERRSKFIKELRSSPEGRAALDEAKLVAEALTRRFGSSDPRRFAEELEARPELAKHAEQIETIARMVDRARHAELSHDHTLKQQMNRSRGLGLSR